MCVWGEVGCEEQTAAVHSVVRGSLRLILNIFVSLNNVFVPDDDDGTCLFVVVFPPLTSERTFVASSSAEDRFCLD